MKKIFLGLLLVLIVQPIFAQQLVNPNATQEAKCLKAYLDDTYGKKMISGQYWDTWATWVKNLTGKTPAILGLDFMDYVERRKAEGAKPTDTQKAIDWVNNKGGIVTFSWHWDAPTDIYDVDYRAECKNTTGGDARWWKAFYSCAVYFDINDALNNPGSAKYNLIIRDIDVIAAELKILQNAGVPVLWRPLHESSGQWFWWGAKGAGPCKKLWALMYDRLTNYHKLNNLIWVWNCYGNEHGSASDWFPGYDKVDIISYDYPRSSSWSEYQTIHGGKGKPFGLAETGGLPNPDNFSNQSWLYFVTWSDFIKNNNSEAEIKRVFTHPKVVTLEDLPNLKNYCAIGENLALNKPVTVSSTEPNFGNIAKNATDGNGITRWSSDYSDVEWIEVDLLKVYDLNQIVLKWEASYATAYTITVSEDRSKWNTYSSTTTCVGGNEKLSFNAKARYIKLTSSKRVSVGGKYFGVSLYEIEAYGSVPTTFDPISAADKLVVAPNPSDGVFTLIKSSESGTWSVCLINGVTILSGSGDRIDLSGFSSGVYLLRVDGKCVKIVKK